MEQEREKNILIVDDDGRNRQYLKALLNAEGYGSLEAVTGEEALALAAEVRPDLILLDAMMPDMDGFEVAQKLKQEEVTRSVPIIMVTALSDRSSKLRALHSGVEEFLTKPVDRAELSIRFRNLLKIKDYNDFLSRYNQILEQQVKERSQELVSSYFDTILTITRAAEFRDEETGAHIRRIGLYSRDLARELGMEDDFVETIFYASPLHDVGKIGIPDHILFKPGPLLPDELAVMKTHAPLGAKILGIGKTSSHLTRMGAEIAQHHHEKWNGKGYPNGLAGEEIPFSARIMAITDVYDALRSKRPYKPPFTHPEALRIILEGDGRTSPEDFDPQVIEAFRRSASHFDKIFNDHRD
jgi:putative two-component system response regulator